MREASEAQGQPRKLKLWLVSQNFPSFIMMMMNVHVPDTFISLLLLLFSSFFLAFSFLCRRRCKSVHWQDLDPCGSLRQCQRRQAPRTPSPDAPRKQASLRRALRTQPAFSPSYTRLDQLDMVDGVSKEPLRRQRLVRIFRAVPERPICIIPEGGA